MSKLNINNRTKRQFSWKRKKEQIRKKLDLGNKRTKKLNETIIELTFRLYLLKYMSPAV